MPLPGLIRFRSFAPSLVIIALCLSGLASPSSSDQRLHFGLGTATTVDKVEIFWPSGKKEEIALPGVDRIFTVAEGKGIVQP